MNWRDLLALIVTTVAAAPLAPFAALGQTKFPERPIRLVVPFSVGGVSDVVARQWAEKMRTLLGTVYVENLGGGAGTIGVVNVAHAQPDGYSLLLGSTSTMVLNAMTINRLPYDPNKDFEPITILCVSPTSIAVNPSVPAKNLKELIAYAKSNPGKLSYGSAGTDSMSHLSGELFKQLTGTTDIVHIPYKGAGPGIFDLISGHIPMMTPNITGQVLALHKAGKICILAVNSAKRLTAAPDIPTAIEEGVPNMIGQLFLGILCTGWNSEGHRGPDRPSNARRIGRSGLSEGFGRIGLRADLQFRTRASEALHDRGAGALDTGAQRHRPQGKLAAATPAIRFWATRSTLLVEATGSSSTNHTKRGCW